MQKLKSVFLGGSRNLNSSHIVSAVVSSALPRFHSIRTGCAQGADSLVIDAMLDAGEAKRLKVFSAFDSTFSNIPYPCDWRNVYRAQQAGAHVFFSSFSGHARARLAARSRSSVVGASFAAWFLSPGSVSSSGSLKAAAFAVRHGIPIASFSCGFFSPPPSLLGLSGSWLRSLLWGFPCWRWLPNLKGGD